MKHQMISLLIQDGDFVLVNGNLLMKSDVITQCTVSTSIYNVLYDTTINSELIPYLQNTPISQYTVSAIVNILRNAYQPLVYQGVLTNFQIKNPEFTIVQGLEKIKITVNVLDSQGNNVIFSWNNFQ